MVFLQDKGIGVLTSADGEKYVGEWKDDKCEGKGKEYRLMSRNKC